MVYTGLGEAWLTHLREFIARLSSIMARDDETFEQLRVLLSDEALEWATQDKILLEPITEPLGKEAVKEDGSGLQA